MNMQVDDVARKRRILLAASGSVAAIKFNNLCLCFSEWAEVKAVLINFLFLKELLSIPMKMNGVARKKLVILLQIELRRWADVMFIAPLSANTLAKIAGGLCDNLLTCIVRAWDYSELLFVAPAMNTLMWNNPFTERHLLLLDEIAITLIPSSRRNWLVEITVMVQ